jgi:hypothetical protein
MMQRLGRVAALLTSPGFRKSLIATLGSAALSWGTIPHAYAVTTAFADNEITAFQILAVPGANVIINNGTSTTSSTANFVPPVLQPPPVHAMPVAVPFVLGTGTFAVSDVPQSTSGPGPFPGQNDFTDSAGLNVNMTGARGDALTAAGNPLAPNAAIMMSDVAEVVTIVGGQQGDASGRNRQELDVTVGGAAGVSLQFKVSGVRAPRASRVEDGLGLALCPLMPNKRAGS